MHVSILWKVCFHYSLTITAASPEASQNNEDELVPGSSSISLAMPQRQLLCINRHQYTDPGSFS